MVFRTTIYSTLTFYDIVHSVATIELTDEVIIEEVDQFLIENPNCTIEELIEKSLKMTAETLVFSTASGTTDPNELRKIGRSHCVGYAAMTNSIVSYGLSKLENSGYQSNHYRGRIYVLGYEVTSLSSSPFFRDHDYVEVTNPGQGIRLRVDPSLYQFTRIGVMNIRHAK